MEIIEINGTWRWKIGDVVSEPYLTKVEAENALAKLREWAGK